MTADHPAIYVNLIILFARLTTHRVQPTKKPSPVAKQLTGRLKPREPPNGIISHASATGEQDGRALALFSHPMCQIPISLDAILLFGPRFSLSEILNE